MLTKHERYDATEAGHARARRYSVSEKGRTRRRRADVKYRTTLGYAVARSRYARRTEMQRLEAQRDEDA